jgi:DNA helicase II / ATP-dependent DNA helicase PcrA
MDMSFYADIHIHSRFSRATSRNLDLPTLAAWARRKGITVLGTGDFTHPAWMEEIREQLVPAEPGLFRVRDDLDRASSEDAGAAGAAPVRFMLQVEISTIYKRGEKTRKVHHLLYAPDIDSAERIRQRLGAIGNIASDGRPILGLDSRDLLEITLEAGEGCYLVPAHIWTPWFSGARLEVRFRLHRRVLRRPGGAHLRGGDGALLGSADEPPPLRPRPLHLGLQLRRPLAR